jgi:hypothetical protein
VIPAIGLAAAALYLVAARTYLRDLASAGSAEPALDGALKPQPA